MKKLSLKKGFTLIELLVVVGIIAILASVIIASLSTARSKGVDGAIKSDMANARAQAEVYYNTNTASPNSYTGYCMQVATNGGAKTAYAQVLAAAQLAHLAGYSTNPVAGGSVTTATCNDSVNSWAAEVPLTSAGVNQMWCVDSTGQSKQETGSSLPANDYICN